MAPAPSGVLPNIGVRFTVAVREPDPCHWPRLRTLPGAATRATMSHESACH